MRLGAIGLFVNDMETMVKFYRDVMGVNIRWDGSGFTSVELDGQIHHFILCKKDANSSHINSEVNTRSKVNDNMELCFDVPFYSDVDKQFERVINAGATIVHKPKTEPYGMRVCFVADPEGNLIEICSGNDDTNQAD